QRRWPDASALPRSAGVSLYTSADLLAHSSVIDTEAQPPITCDLLQLVEQVHSPQEAYPLPKLRYQLAEFLNPSSLNRVRRSSPHPPVSVYGTVNANLKLRGFSRKRGVDHFEDRSPLVLSSRC